MDHGGYAQISDLLNWYTDLGVDALRWAMVIVLIFNVISAIGYIIAARYLLDDLPRNDGQEDTPQAEGGAKL